MVSGTARRLATQQRVNGGQQGQIILNMDGAASQDSGNLNTGYISPSVDSISEVKLLIENYTAEYGGRTAGQFTLTTKNGTPQFHGSVYDYYRHERLNANEFFNNLTNVARPRYRYQNPGGTIGGLNCRCIRWKRCWASLDRLCHTLPYPPS